jgi:hypothetical protein
LLGAAGSAFGLGTCGWVVDFLLDQLKWDTIRAYRVIFWAYSALAIVMFCIVSILSKACELDHNLQDTAAMSSDEDEPPEQKKISFFKKLPHFSRKSKIVVMKLCALFALDSFASNLAPV